MGSGSIQKPSINPLNAKLNPICPLLALLGAHRILYVSSIRVKPRYEQVTHISHPNSNGMVLVYFYNTPRHIGSAIIIKAENK
jgi:hypothetical protein